MNDLSSLIGIPSLITIHGRGKGGGEVVAGKLAALYAALPGGLKIVRSCELSYTTIKQLQREVSSGMMLFTAGIRDLPNIVKARLAGQPFAVYVQVPYLRAISWKDPLHAISVILYLLAISLFANHILVNSRKAADGIIGRSAKVILPITREELLPHPLSHIPPPDTRADILRLNLVCRLARERGRGARDIAGIIRLLHECALHNQREKHQVHVHHYGECDKSIKEQLLHAAHGCLTMHGHVANWTEHAQGPLLFQSNYEGFGLAAFEAARAGREVWVNDAFPPELFLVCPEIKRIKTGHSVPLLAQIQELA